LIAITWQLAAAFGQGAGTMIVTTGAAEAVMGHYQRQLRDIQDWDRIALQMIEYTRALGAASAMWALRRGGAIIDIKDVKAAIGKLKQSQPPPMFECPICLEK
jgi:hypothetical protein